ncbi:MAG TPA: transcriptional initiation protein Tat [Planctomycetes bacterium]|nr:transcriptional initiation protein Tat [Planctomycetota bacterium]
MLLRMLGAIVVCTCTWSCAAAPAGVRVVPEAEGAAGGMYVANRTPLAPSPFAKLPIGSIVPKGWLRHMLELEARGMIGRLSEISPWLRFETSAWGRMDGTGERGWEELPYWLKGFGDLGYALGDKEIIGEARRWIDVVLSSQREDGWFGPRALLTSLDGKPDLWPHMVMLNVLQSFYEYTNDPRVIPFMLKYCAWENRLPPSAFGEGYWPKIRAGDNIETAHWLYNRTGEPWLLELAAKIHANMARWNEDVINWHNVNIAQGFRAGTVFSVQSGDAKDAASAERNYRKVTDIYGQFAGGTFVSDENCRPGYIDPRGGFETCGIVEFMHSFQMLTKITGAPIWADRCEEIAFNSFPASMTPAQTGLHYLTCANQAQLDNKNKSPGVQNGGTMFSYSPFECYRCCQHNVSHGWPYYAEELWLATPDKGLCASLYAACEVSAKVGDGTAVTIVEETDYPFSDTIVLRVKAPKAVAFPLYLRIPRWCAAPAVAVNDQAVSLAAPPLSYAILDRTWEDGDAVTVRFPMEIAVTKWAKNRDSVSVARGPLAFSLAIGEKWQRYGASEKWPEWEVFPTTPWNYGLVLDEANPAASFTVVPAGKPVPPNPFTPEAAPIMLKAKARKIPGWQLDRNNMVGVLQKSPARSGEPEEDVTLIPLGAARLRISSFPTIGTGPDATEWVGQARPRASQYRASASHCHATDSTDALGDGLEPSSSDDPSIPRFTWWPHRGTAEWVQFDFTAPRQVSAVEVYWFDDEGRGQCRVPASWKLLYKDGEEWKPVAGAADFGTAKNKYNAVAFDQVTTTALRIEAALTPEFSGGVLEWKVK